MATSQSKIPRNGLYEKRSDGGICNICQKPVKLTKEHTPPEGCLRECSLKLSLFPRFDPSARPVFTQSGIRHVTTCKTCNSTLGHGADNELKLFCERIGDFWGSLNSGGSPEAMIACNVGAVLRSVFGHALAANPYTPRGPIYDEMRGYVLGLSPGSQRIPYVHYYIHEDNFVHIDQSTMYHVGSDFITVMMLKWWPVAFVISPRLDLIAVPRLNDFLTPIGRDVKIPIRAKPANWYEEITAAKTRIVTGYDSGSAKGYPRTPARAVPSPKASRGRRVRRRRTKSP